MDEKLVTNGTELPTGADLPVEAGLPVETGFPIEAGLPVETALPIKTGLPVEAVLPDDTGLPAITEFVSHSYSYLINKFQNSIISELIGIVLQLDRYAWLAFLLVFLPAVLIFIYMKISTKPLSNLPHYIRVDNLYENHNHFMGLILFSSLVFVPYAYNITGHEVSYLKYIGLGILSILVCYLAWIPIFITRYFLVLKWKKETLKFFESSSNTDFENYHAKQYTWKNKDAEKTYLLFLAKISTSRNLIRKVQPIKEPIIDSSDRLAEQGFTTLIVFIIASIFSWNAGGDGWWFFPFCTIGLVLNYTDSKPVDPKKTKVKYIFFLIQVGLVSLLSNLIVCGIAWKAGGGWWWLLPVLFVGLMQAAFEKQKVSDVSNESINSDIKLRSPKLSIPAEQRTTKTPSLSTLTQGTEQKVTKPSDPVPQNDSNNKTEPKPNKSSSALGIWTFIAFVTAFFAGGWWWVLAIIMGLIWLGNKGENKQENVSAQTTAPVFNTNIPTNNLSGWAKQLTDICAQYSGNDYFVAELIPAQKLENAMKQYPLPGLVITLIDATVFGSADNGMLIGKKGISWRNKVVVGKSDLCWHDGLYNGNRFTLMTWKYFAKQTIKLENTNIRVGSDNIFDMSICQFDKNKIIALLNAIQQAYLRQDSSQPLNQTNDVSKNVPKKQKQKHEDVRTVTWSERLTNVCLQYRAKDFYVWELIPQNKLQFAMKEYPTPDNGKIVALVDTSAFDSIQGMAIGEHGVSWLNRLSHSYSSYYWKDFSIKVISLEDGLLKIGKSGSFELIGDSQQNKTLVAFLQNIQRVYLERENEYKHPEDIIDQVLSQDSKQQQGIKISTDIPRQSESIKVTNNLIDLNTADLDSLLALPGIGVAEAKSLIKHRDVAGSFTSTKQVLEFLNLKPHHANQWKDRVVINETISPQTSTTAATPNPEIRRPLGGRTID